MYSGYELIWLFFCTSFLGWLLETVSAATRQRKFANRGIVNAPFCVIYGVAAVSTQCSARNFMDFGCLQRVQFWRLLLSGLQDI